MKLRSINLTGRIARGQGKEVPLWHATVVRPYGSEQEIQIHLASEGSRGVFVNLSTEDARKLASLIIETIEEGRLNDSVSQTT